MSVNRSCCKSQIIVLAEGQQHAPTTCNHDIGNLQEDPFSPSVWDHYEAHNEILPKTKDHKII